MDHAECIVIIPNWPTQPYCSKVMEMLVSLPLVLPCQPQLLQLPHDPHRRLPLFPKLQLLACKLSGNPLREENISGHSADIILASWRSGTQKQYQPYINKWLNYCCERELDSLHPSLADVIQFLTSLFERNLSYSSLNTERSALSTIITVDGMSIDNRPRVVSEGCL